jgi:hypothetical protein
MHWQTVLLQSNNDFDATTLKDTLKQTGYKFYDPFPGGLGAPIGKVDRYRMFLSPRVEGWQRLLVHPQDTISESLVSLLANGSTTLHLMVYGDEKFQIGVKGADVGTDWQALSPFLRDGCTLEDVAAAATQTVVIERQDEANLPPELQQMAREQGVKGEDVDKLMGKMSKRLFKKAAKHDSEADIQQVQAAVSGQSAGMNWNSVAGQRLAAVMQCVAVPTDYWRKPTWHTLTGAYQVARQQQRGKGHLLPGDEEKLAAVPNALDYQLLYFSKKRD